jgi:hypothetical protein
MTNLLTILHLFFYSIYGQSTICKPDSMEILFSPGYFSLENFVNYSNLYMNGPIEKIGKTTKNNGRFKITFKIEESTRSMSMATICTISKIPY